MNYDHGVVSMPLNRKECEILYSKLKGKEKLLIGLGLQVGLPIEEVEQLKAGDIRFPLNIKGRQIAIPKDLQEILSQYRALDTYQRVFRSGADYMQKVVLKLTEEKLGAKRSYQALRRTYVKNCAESSERMERVIENTGESADTIYKYYKVYKHNGQGF
jgi:hypothetical protein